MKNVLISLFALGTTGILNKLRSANSSNSGTLRGNLSFTATADQIVVRYYDTDILTVTAAGLLTINLGGFATASTYKHLNNSLRGLGLGAYGVSRKDFTPYVNGVAIEASKPNTFNLFA